MMNNFTKIELRDLLLGLDALYKISPDPETKALMIKVESMIANYWCDHPGWIVAGRTSVCVECGIPL